MSRDLYKVGGKCRPFLKRIKANRLKYVAERRAIRVRETVNALGAIEKKGFVFTNNLKVLAEVIGHLKSHGIPYEYIDGGKNWKYAIRRTDREEGK